MKTYSRVGGAVYFQTLAENNDIDVRLFTVNTNPSIQKQLFKKFVGTIHLELHSFCNRKCSYCPVSQVDRLKNPISLESKSYEGLLENLRSIDFDGRISINVYNEPLADESTIAKIESIRRHLPEVRISSNSNGDYLTKELLDKLAAAGLNDLFVTLHTPPSKSYEDCHRLEALFNFYFKIGLKPEFKSFRSERRIETKAKYENLNLEVFCTNWSSPDLGNSRGSTVKSLETKQVRDFPCFRPFREMVIHSNGDVYPCCEFFPDIHGKDYPAAGSIHTDDIFSIYSGKVFANYRRHLFNFTPKSGFCKHCMEDKETVNFSLAPQHHAVVNSLKNEASPEIELQ